MPVCEDLATKIELEELKDEVQELRDQLNTVLGEDESGAVKKVFEIGSTAKEAKDTAELAIWGLTKLRAAGALTDIRQAITGFLPNSTNLAQGASKWIQVAGNGATKPMINLDKVSAIAGKGSASSKLLSKVGGGSLAGLSILSDLIQLQGTLAINIGTVKVLDKRIEAEARGARSQIDAVNDGLLRLYSKNEGDITIIKNYLDIVSESLEINKINNTFNGQDLDAIKEEIKTLEPNLDEVWAAINDLRAKNSQVKIEVEELADDLEEVIENLNQSIADLEKKLDNALQIIEDIRAEIEKLNEEIDLIKARLTELEGRVTKAEEDIVTLRSDLTDLEADLRAEIKLADARSKSNEADILLLLKKVSKQTFDGIEQKFEEETEPGEEEVNQNDLEELKEYIHNKVTDLLNVQFSDKIEPAVKLIEEEVKHEDYGLEKIQDFADTAWESTQNDKALDATILAFCIHNSLMLSNDLPNTISEASSLDFSSLQLKDQTGELYKTNEKVSSKTQSLLSSLSSPEARQALTTRIDDKNRPYQASVNLFQGLRSILASGQDITEKTGINVAKMGNALRDSGVVERDLYEHFSQVPRRFNKLLVGLETSEDSANSLRLITQEVKQLLEQSSQYNLAREEFANQLEEEKQTVARIEEVNNRRIETLPQPTEEDKLETEDN